MRILTITRLYPNAIMPNHAIFVENRLRKIVATGRVSARVLAPVPWFPSRNSCFGVYASYASVPHEEERHGLLISHPRFLVIPKVGLNLQPASYLKAVRRSVEKLKDFDFDLIDAHYLFPDGVAAGMLARELGKPVVITARGTDLNLIATLPGPDRQIRAALGAADGVITVSNALGERARQLGVTADRLAVLPNGVDTEVFRPVEGAKWRALAPGAKAIIVSVGNLIPLKGHDLVIRALAGLDGVHLLIAGVGPESARLSALAARLGLADRVHLLGAVGHEDLAGVYSAADVLVLASEREGWPNVLLEAMACGTPVAATRVGGIPEIVTTRAAGKLCDRSPEALASAVQDLLVNRPSREAVRAHAQQFGWNDTVARQIAFYETVIERARGPQRLRASG
ncbi:MAG: glycosyltransferase family 4 protein [Alphaproteobacteria bacterium]